MPRRRAIYDIDLRTRAFERKLIQLDQRVAKFEKRVGRVGSPNMFAGSTRSAFQFAGALTGIGTAAFFAQRGIREVTTGASAMAAQFEQTNIAFETFLGSAQRAGQLVGELREFAKFTPFTTSQTFRAGRQLLAFGVPADELLGTLRTLGDISAGVGTERLGQIILAYGQVRAQTKLAGQELRQFTEAGIPLLDELAAVLGKTPAEIKRLVFEGRIGFPLVRQALMNLTSEGGRFFNLMEKQSQTFSGRLSTLAGNWELVQERIGKSINQRLRPFVNAAIDVTGRWTEATEKGSEEIRRQAIVARGLFAALQRGNQTERERGSIINMINDRYGEYLDNMLTEKTSTQELDDAYKKLNSTLRNRLAIQVKQEVLGEKLTEQSKLLAEQELLRLRRTAFATLRETRGDAARRDVLETFGLRSEFLDPRTARFAEELEKAQFEGNQKRLEILTRQINRAGGAIDKQFGTSTGGTTGNLATQAAARSAVGGGITGRSPVNLVVNVEKLVEEINFENTNLKESETEVSERVKRVLLTLLNDVNILGGN